MRAIGAAATVARLTVLIITAVNTSEPLSGHSAGILVLSRGSRTACLQAGHVRRPRRGFGARYRPGCDAQADREIRGQTAGRVADALSADSTKYDPRSFQTAKSAVRLDHAAVGVWSERRQGRRLRSARNSGRE